MVCGGVVVVIVVVVVVVVGCVGLFHFLENLLSHLSFFMLLF